ncbi:Mediator of RNA polymerase II transcription subunit 31 [Teratosphaeria destructans]|uniref:Mediator of RNA polymerase II transcription subunit 31 n=1 Tax=Teratosphaeria destructans TaxID=418781 RepID=A0A9W7SZA7_9PEZI|nr:Mediator of RNA polymerase II transcription subunit 31 [Teratosphaeria destructans]
MASQQPNDGAKARDPDHYGGKSRFELELEVSDQAAFVQALGNPYYLHNLADSKVLYEPEFVAYIKYLRYWSSPEYIKYLSFPGPALKALDLLQEERFRKDMINPMVRDQLVADWSQAAIK